MHVGRGVLGATGHDPGDGWTSAQVVDDDLGNQATFYLVALPLMAATFGWAAGSCFRPAGRAPPRELARLLLRYATVRFVAASSTRVRRGHLSPRFQLGVCRTVAHSLYWICIANNPVKGVRRLIGPHSTRA